MKFGNQDISKTITARSLKLGQLIEITLSRLPCKKLKYMLKRKSLVSTDTVCNNFACQS